MTDKELLEFAAKAAGIDGFDHYDGSGAKLIPVGEFDAIEWTPLTDDGDALRLAVKLGLNVNVESTTIDVYDRDLRLTRVWAEEVKDPYAATRRAVVRAAAEIGKAME